MKRIFFSLLFLFAFFQSETYAQKIGGFGEGRRHVVLKKDGENTVVFNQWSNESGEIIINPGDYPVGLYQFEAALPSQAYIPNSFAYIEPNLPAGIVTYKLENNTLTVNSFAAQPPLWMYVTPVHDIEKKIGASWTYGGMQFQNLEFQNYFLYIFRADIKEPIAEIFVINPNGRDEGAFYIDNDEEDGDIFMPRPNHPKIEIIEKKPREKIPNVNAPEQVDELGEAKLGDLHEWGEVAGDFKKEAVLASVEELYKNVPAYNGNALNEITVYIQQKKLNHIERAKFNRIIQRDILNRNAYSELDFALHALSGNNKNFFEPFGLDVEQWPNFQANELWGKELKDGTKVRALEFLGRVWNAIQCHPNLGEKNLMKDNLVIGLGRCVSDFGTRECMDGKVEQSLLALQGYIKGIRLDAPDDAVDPKTFVTKFINDLYFKLDDESPLYEFLVDREKKNLEPGEFKKFIQETIQKFMDVLNKNFNQRERNIKKQLVIEFYRQLNDWITYYNKDED